ncbi:hypothetical protein FEM48_Zijuj09G0148200 [Ziziphus jujuba var. spinosa]|uniref:Uncharacterized protein n=1 Tax=Ziziphus jujuba var. spinosa TaxID=714518 RepID=A0A978UTL8_ZIZJJ|nr:hypothetical protein FEM48_Zijuj09G0148200 [Ziziphus jujuba var. spinosa]
MVQSCSSQRITKLILHCKSWLVGMSDYRQCSDLDDIISKLQLDKRIRRINLIVAVQASFNNSKIPAIKLVVSTALEGLNPIIPDVNVGLETLYILRFQL